MSDLKILMNDEWVDVSNIHCLDSGIIPDYENIVDFDYLKQLPTEFSFTAKLKNGKKVWNDLKRTFKLKKFRLPRKKKKLLKKYGLL
jgi:hypothetical protein